MSQDTPPSTDPQDNRPLETKFAPAERASADDVNQQHRHYANLTLVQDMIDALPNAFLVLNEQRQAVLVNRALLRMIAEDEHLTVVGKRMGELLDCEHADDSAGGCGTAEACRNCGAVRAMLASLEGRENVQECRITQANGDSFDFRVWATPLQIDGKPFSIFAIQDIADEKRRQFLERIFFHDVLNTAGGIAMFGDLLKVIEPEEVHQIAGELDSLVGRLINEIQSQRDLLAAEHGTLEVVPLSVSANDVLAEVHSQYVRRAVAKKKSIVIRDSGEDVTFTSDETLVGRVLGNMLKNALEAIKADEAVTLGYSVQDGWVVFEVHNPGYIPRHIQAQIFQRSFSTKGAGRGLGTYSIRLLTERFLGGRAGFVSTRDGGTRFHAAYPIDWA